VCVYNIHFKNKKVCVHLLDGSSVSLIAKPWDTPSQLCTQVATKIGLSGADTMALYEMKENSIMRLEEQESVLDFQIAWPEVLAAFLSFSFPHSPFSPSPISRTEKRKELFDLQKEANETQQT